jgi:hypothetical protein
MIWLPPNAASNANRRKSHFLARQGKGKNRFVAGQGGTWSSPDPQYTTPFAIVAPPTTDEPLLKD